MYINMYNLISREGQYTCTYPPDLNLIYYIRRRFYMYICIHIQGVTKKGNTFGFCEKSSIFQLGSRKFQRRQPRNFGIEWYRSQDDGSSGSKIMATQNQNCVISTFRFHNETKDDFQLTFSFVCIKIEIQFFLYECMRVPSMCLHMFRSVSAVFVKLRCLN